jgi:hypothetical protein
VPSQRVLLGKRARLVARGARPERATLAASKSKTPCAAPKAQAKGALTDKSEGYANRSVADWVSRVDSHPVAYRCRRIIWAATSQPWLRL